MSPTYRNDSTRLTWRGLDFSGEVVNVLPGHSVLTQHVLTESFMTKTANTPYYNPYVTWEAVRSSGETKTQVVDPELVHQIELYNRAESSGEANIRLNNVSNNIAAILPPGRSIAFPESEVFQKVSSVIIECSSGAVLDYIAKKKE
jgi:hypothetical protein